MCVLYDLKPASAPLSYSDIVGRIFIYDFLLASDRMISFSVKKFVQRNFSPLNEKILCGKNYCRDRSARKQFLNTRRASIVIIREIRTRKSSRNVWTTSYA